MTASTRALGALVAAASLLGLGGCALPFSDQPAAAATPVQVPVSAAATCAGSTLAEMDRAQRVGQLMLVGVPVESNRSAVPLLQQLHLGGVALTGSITTSIPPARAAVTRLVEASPDDPRPWVAVTQEGGTIQTLRGDDFTTLPPTRKQAGWDAQQTIDAVVAAAGALHETGVNLTLSPLVDIGGPRSFGTEADAVATQVHLTVQALEAERVAATLKRFPGAQPDVTIDGPALVPFVTGIEAGADLVMLSGDRYPTLDPDRPAVFSRQVVTDVLRGIVAFRGVVVSSDLADADLAETPLARRGVDFLEAGGDQVLVSDAAAATTVLDGLLAADAASPEMARLVDAAALRILTAKAERDVVSCG